MEFILRVPGHADYTQKLHWLKNKEEVIITIKDIASKNDLNLSNEADIDELHGIIDIVPFIQVLSIYDLDEFKRRD
jgi:hypothetical protein